MGLLILGTSAVKTARAPLQNRRQAASGQVGRSGEADGVQRAAQDCVGQAVHS